MPPVQRLVSLLIWPPRLFACDGQEIRAIPGCIESMRPIFHRVTIVRKQKDGCPVSRSVNTGSIPSASRSPSESCKSTSRGSGGAPHAWGEQGLMIEVFLWGTNLELCFDGPVRGDPAVPFLAFLACLYLHSSSTYLKSYRNVVRIGIASFLSGLEGHRQSLTASESASMHLFPVPTTCPWNIDAGHVLFSPTVLLVLHPDPPQLPCRTVSLQTKYLPTHTTSIRYVSSMAYL